MHSRDWVSASSATSQSSQKSNECVTIIITEILWVLRKPRSCKYRKNVNFVISRDSYSFAGLKNNRRLWTFFSFLHFTLLRLLTIIFMNIVIHRQAAKAKILPFMRIAQLMASHLKLLYLHAQRQLAGSFTLFFDGSSSHFWRRQATYNV